MIRDMTRPARGLTALAVAMTFAMAGAMADDRNQTSSAALPTHFIGTLDDHTPSAAVVSGGPYEMHGSWSLSLNDRQGTGRFTADMDMGTSDFGITQGNVDKDNPATRKPHTHHISMTDGVLEADWAAYCPEYAATAAQGFAVTGNAVITANGAPVPFGNPSAVAVCIVGNGSVKYSNMTLTIGAPSNVHFGAQAIHGVVQRCSGRLPRQSRDCRVQP